MPTTAGPVAPNQSLAVAARHHSEDMARNNLFQHETIPGSAYYNSATQPEPWDRMRAEGYSYSTAGENIAAGYNGAEEVYVGWWKSTGHRQNMYNASMREIGNGYFYLSSSTYRGYYTMDLGAAGGSCFFTDTLFRDANNNGVYDQGEGVSNVVIRLIVGGVPATYCDTPTAVGSFAIPIQSISAGATAQVTLSNAAAAAVTVSLPRDYSTSTAVVLGAGETRVIGTFIKASGLRNAGFRELQPVSTITAPRVTLTRSASGAQLQWSSE